MPKRKTHEEFVNDIKKISPYTKKDKDIKESIINFINELL